MLEGDAELDRDLLDLNLAQWPTSLAQVGPQRVGRYEPVGGETVRLVLLRRPLALLLIEIGIALVMEQDVPGLVEEGEPELVVALVAQAQLDQRPGRA
jgi:hypothetical protein